MHHKTSNYILIGMSLNGEKIYEKESTTYS